MPRIRLLILDVDGVLTTGALPYGTDGNLEKTFHVQDGGAIRLWQRHGGTTAIISGRSSPVVDKRAQDLGVTEVHQAVQDKLAVYESVREKHRVADEEIAFVGDDLVDLAVMRRCGYPIAVANAVTCVKRAARYVTRRPGGEGAVNEAIRRLWRDNGQLEAVMAEWRH